MPDEDRAERRADQRDQVEREHDHRERGRVRDTQDLQHDERRDACDRGLQQGALDVVAGRVGDRLEHPPQRVAALGRLAGAGTRRAIVVRRPTMKIDSVRIVTPAKTPLTIPRPISPSTPATSPTRPGSLPASSWSFAVMS